MKSNIICHQHFSRDKNVNQVVTITATLDFRRQKMGQSGILTFSVNKNKIIVFISHGEYTTDLQIYWNLHNLGSKKLYFFKINFLSWSL